MCQVGDIIVIEQYKDRGKIISKHSFVVISDKNGKIEGIPYDFVANVMSSFKSNLQKERKLKRYPGNFPIVENDRVVENDNGKAGYIKTDQLYYFQRDSIEFETIGYLKDDILNLLLEFLEEANFDIVNIVDNLVIKDT